MSSMVRKFQFKRLRLISLVLMASVSLAACKSADERAEERYQSGVKLVEEGDYDRAIVEFRSVFELNGAHLEARRALADVLLNKKNRRQRAYSQYLRLAEQYPDDIDTRIVLSEIAFDAGNWDEFERHGGKAEELAPDNPRVQVLAVARQYRQASIDDDASARRDQARAAKALMEGQPDNMILRNIQIDDLLRDGEFREALVEIDWILERRSDDTRMWLQRQQILVQLEDYDALEEQLRMMIDRFPKDETHKTTLIRFFLARQETDKAEGFLRELADASDETGPRIDLIRFLQEVRGRDAAISELEKMIASDPDVVIYKVLKAGFDFDAGQRDQAIALLEEVIEGAEESTEDIRNSKLTLARMFITTGNEVGARALVEEVLTEDAASVEALKLKAAWQIEADDTDAAIAGLRIALDNAPEDEDAMTLMAQAYTRAGQPQLARDFLALAVEASGNAPEETIRYATQLLQEERYLPAEDILLPALRQAPQDVGLLSTLGQLYLQMPDYGRVDQVVQTLRSLNDERAGASANQLEAQKVSRQSGPDEAVAFLENLAGQADASMGSKIALIRAQMATGNIEGARNLARDLLADEPDNVVLKSILAASEAVAGNLDAAETLYREVLDANPRATAIWLELARIKTRQGNIEAARATVDEALGAFPDSADLLWARASYMEQDGDIDAAIDIYEELYEQNSNSTIIANNLASLLGTYREDDESLERAWTLARRFRDAENAALQDTYGWIAHRRGDSQEALPYLEAAAKGLPDDPIVQYHLAQIYLALGRTDDALAQFRRAVDIAGPADQREQIKTAKAQINAIQSAAEEDAEDTEPSQN